jgi:two-component system cell cycle sensor histidine kinase/response regulator CckA
VAKPKLMIVEDDHIVAMDLQGILQSLGYVVSAVVSRGEEAIEKADQTRPDLALMDIRLRGDMDGIETAEQFRTRFDIPVVFLTAYADKTTLERAKLTAPLAYVIKPFDQRELHSAIEVALYRYQMERRLRESETRFRTLVENIPVGMFRTTSDLFGAFLMANPAFLRMFGFNSQEELDGQATQILADHRQIEILRDTLLTQGGVNRAEHQLKKRDGTLFWGALTLTAVYDAHGDVQWVDGIVEDITDRKQAEQEIRRRVAQQEALNAIIAAGAAASDLQELLETALNHTLNALDVEAGGIWMPPYAYERALPPGVYAMMEQTAPAGMFNTISSIVVKDWQQVSDDDPLSKLRPLLEQIGVRASLTVPFVADGQRIGGLGLVLPEPRPWSKEEITLVETVGQQLGVAAERLRLLEKTRQQAQQVQQIMDTVPEGVLLLDATGRIILANPLGTSNLIVLAGAQEGDTLTHLGDRPLEELLTSPPKGLWHEVMANSRVFQILARPIETAIPSNTARSEPTEGWVLVIRDITQQREAERRIQQQERLASVGQLAAGIAHDFKNTLGTIILYSQMAAQADGLPARDRDQMETISQQARHAIRLIEQILDFGRRANLERGPLDLRPFLDEQVKLLQRILPENIEIKLSYDPGEHTVNADPTRLQQAITNLAVNARDAMPGGGTLHFGLRRITSQEGTPPPLPEMTAEGTATNEWVQVTVSDTGTGIPPDVLPHVFDPFFTTKPPGEGSGLGLAQVHGILGQHDGYIDVESQLGQGTTFVIYLPVLPADSADSHAASSLKDPLSLPLGNGETILVVEDNSMLKRVLAMSLEDLNYRVLAAGDGSEALELLEQHDEIALVLSDVVMPKMGGIPLLNAMKKRDLHMAMILLTGHPLEEELDELQAHGTASLPVNWLPKPVQLEQLADAVNRALKARDHP